jgi:dTDP-4-dehydrorhamnose 3,5-epimerase
MTLNYACVYGRVKLVLYDDREDSATRGEVMELFLGPADYQLVQIPTNVWNSFRGLGEETSIIANCATEPHTKEFTEAIDPLSDSLIPYDWRQPSSD